MERQQTQKVVKDLRENKQMVIIVGPRQAGKTWLALEVGKHFSRTVYLNYDNIEHQQIIHTQTWPVDTDLLIFDELHKMPKWKNYLKGVFDTKPTEMRILVTGSATMKTHSQAGDSMAGRFFLHHLLPFSPAELEHVGTPPNINKLLNIGGFPEAYLAADEVTAKRWQQQYVDSLLRTDILEFQDISNLRAMRLLFDALRKRVGSPINFSNLARDLDISPHTVKRYIEVFEALYIVFRVTPYNKNILRGLQKPPKLYFYDNGLVDGNVGQKYENLVAISLLKDLYYQHDYLAKNKTLHYLRTKEEKEVDFVIVENDNIEAMFEVKANDKDVSKNLLYFHDKYQLPGTQLVGNLATPFKMLKHDIVVNSVERYLKMLHC